MHNLVKRPTSISRLHHQTELLMSFRYWIFSLNLQLNQQRTCLGWNSGTTFVIRMIGLQSAVNECFPDVYIVNNFTLCASIVLSCAECGKRSVQVSQDNKFPCWWICMISAVTHHSVPLNIYGSMNWCEFVYSFNIWTASVTVKKFDKIWNCTDFHQRISVSMRTARDDSTFRPRNWNREQRVNNIKQHWKLSLLKHTKGGQQMIPRQITK